MVFRAKAMTCSHENVTNFTIEETNYKHPHIPVAISL